MIKSFTLSHELIRYAYNELNLADSDRVQRGIDGDPLLASEYAEIIRVLETLDKVPPLPDSLVEKVLDVASGVK